MLPVLFLAIIITATAALPSNSKQVSKNDVSDFPVVGEVWGPVIVHAGVMKTVHVQNSNTIQSLRPTYYYPSRTGQQDVIADYIQPSEIFSNKKNMEKYIQSAVTNDDVVVQLDAAALDGKYLEVVSSKVIPSDSIKMVCHSYKTELPFCHNLVATNHKFKLMYSMVRSVNNGNLFPTVFVSHQGCARENGRLNCYWISHVNEIVVLDKGVL